MNFDMADHVLDLFLSQARSRHSTRRSIQILSLKVIWLRVSLKYLVVSKIICQCLSQNKFVLPKNTN